MLTGCLLSEALYWPELIDIPVLLNRKVGVLRMSQDLIRLPHDLIRLWRDKGGTARLLVLSYRTMLRTFNASWRVLSMKRLRANHWQATTH